MYEEYMHAEVDMKKMKKVIKNNFSSHTNTNF